MAVKFSPPGYRWFHFLRNVPVRIGIYSGFCLSLVFTSWIVIANRISYLEPFALHRNIVASLLLILIAAIPVIRFLRAPADMLISGLLAWSLLTFTYRLLGVIFVRLREDYSTFHVLVLGIVAYLIFSTLSWLGMIVWRVREAHGSHVHR